MPERIPSEALEQPDTAALRTDDPSASIRTGWSERGNAMGDWGEEPDLVAGEGYGEEEAEDPWWVEPAQPARQHVDRYAGLQEAKRLQAEIDGEPPDPAPRVIEGGGEYDEHVVVRRNGVDSVYAQVGDRRVLDQPIDVVPTRWAAALNTAYSGKGDAPGPEATEAGETATAWKSYVQRAHDRARETLEAADRQRNNGQ